MPVYFFQLVPPGAGRGDDPGVELRDVEQAYLQAHQAALDISFEMLRVRQDPCGLHFEVTNEAGELLFDLPFSEALNPRTRPVPLGSLCASLRQTLERQHVLAADLRKQFDRATSAIAETRELLARPIPH